MNWKDNFKKALGSIHLQPEIPALFTICCCHLQLFSKFYDNKCRYLICVYFGCIFSKAGFSTTGNSLQTYARKAWLGLISCEGDEKDVMQCKHSRFSAVPPLLHTYRRGTWLYCFGGFVNDTNYRYKYCRTCIKRSSVYKQVV
jgi:hypothetical protein